jgi:hypothetical protein
MLLRGVLSYLPLLSGQQCGLDQMMVGCCPLVWFHWRVRWVCTSLSTRSTKADLEVKRWIKD